MKKLKEMRVISSSELRSNMKKYLDMARKEDIIIQRGRNETFTLRHTEYLEPDEDLARAISFEEFREGALSHVRELYNSK